MDKLPYVSILMPTYNRKNFLGLALDNVLNQTYPKEKLELMIIDDGLDNFIDDENYIRNLLYPIKLKYISIDNKNKLKIGVKRNYLVQYASYDTLINMDDDDIYLNNYVLKSILYLLLKNVELVGSNQMIFYFYKYDKFTKIICPSKRQIHESTMCFTKNHFNKTGGFLPVQTGEGPGMIDGHEEHVHNIDIDGLTYLVCHENNTYPKDSFLFKKELDLKLKPNKLKFIKDIFKIK